MPLAIELAAVRLRALPLEELADRLDRRIDRGLALLTGGGEGGDGRHRTLRDAIGWSYDLCTPAEQALWARLSVFAGSFSVDAAEEVCAGGELSPGQIFDTIIRLVDKSVITRDDAAAGEGGQPTRYQMLDTIREFGAERLAASGAEAGVRNRFIARYLSMARYFGEHVVDDDQLDRFRELRREHANLRAALEQVGEQRFDQILAVVKSALDRDRVDVRQLDRRHLPPLHLGNAVARVEDENVDRIAVAAGFDRRRAGIARGRTDDRHMLMPPRQHRVEQPADELRCRSLKARVGP